VIEKGFSISRPTDAPPEWGASGADQKRVSRVVSML
jgi:hypothetical protein